MPISAPLSRQSSVWQGTTARFATDFLLSLSVFMVGAAYWLERTLAGPGLAAMALLVASGQLVAGLGQFRPGIAVPPRLLRLLIGNILAVATYSLLRPWLGPAVSRTTYAEMLAVVTLLQIVVRVLLARPAAVMEGLRWTGGIAVSLWIHQPLLTTGTIGAGDAAWYRQMTADFVEQWRQGVFPVLAGQSEFAFNGAVSPFRLAPGLQYFAGLVDLATLRSLPFSGILNLTLLACYVSTTLACYLCLRAIDPAGPWRALLLALCFSMAPALPALAYSGDLYLSIAALPFVPPLLYGTWRSVNRGDLPGTLLMSASAAALWYCHPPIALWGCSVALLCQLFRLGRDWRRSSFWSQTAIGAGCFAVLALGELISAGTLGLPGLTVDRMGLLGNLRMAFWDSLSPVDPEAGGMGVYQLGWPLWCLLAAGLLLAVLSRPRLATATVGVASLLVLAYLVPYDGLNAALWSMLPRFYLDLTNLWPMQRLYVLLACLVVILFAAAFHPIVKRRPRLSSVLALALAGAVFLSAAEVVKFQRHARRTTTPVAAVSRQMLPQNRILTRYAFNPFPLPPPYYSHGFVDPLIPNRILGDDAREEIASNAAVLDAPGDPGRILASGILQARRPDPSQPSLVLAPSLRLEPGRHYVLSLEFDHPEFVGSLVLEGTRLKRAYWLPDSAYDTKTVAPSRAFGAMPGRPHAITLWTDGTEPEEIRLSFFFTGPAPATEVTRFGQFRFWEYTPGNLPVAIEGWVPFQARVTVDRPGFLETPRLFLPGYSAVVNGQKREPRSSPHGLVMIPLETGRNDVTLDYRGTGIVRTALLVSLVGWLGLLGSALVHWWRRIGGVAEIIVVTKAPALKDSL